MTTCENVLLLFYWTKNLNTEATVYLPLHPWIHILKPCQWLLCLKRPLLHHTANLMVKHAEQYGITHFHSVCRSELKSVLDMFKSLEVPFLRWAQQEMLFPCRKYVAKVTEERVRVCVRARETEIPPEYQDCRCRHGAQCSTLSTSLK